MGCLIPNGLTEDQVAAVTRFQGIHSDEGEGVIHALGWKACEGSGEKALACTCGATLHVSEPIHVTVEFVEGETGRGTSGRWRNLEAESLCQSALVTLPEEAFEQIRLCPSRGKMHFGLGLYLRNAFLHSGVLHAWGCPDRTSGEALDMLIRHCIPELLGYEHVYRQIESGALYDAYRYCMEVRGVFPGNELGRHYSLLLDAEAIEDANPYSILDDDHFEERREWYERSWAKRAEYDAATLREIWDFERIRKDVDPAIADECERACLFARDEGVFLPSEVAYVMAGSSEDVAMRAFDWAVESFKAWRFLPSGLFERRDLFLRAVALRGEVLERAQAFVDDEEIVVAAVSQCPSAIELASPRLRECRRVLVAAAENAVDDLVFFEGVMAAHNDDDELVGLAVDANGANIAYASERIRGDFEWAMRAVTHHCDIYPEASYEHLSDDLKQDKRIALAVAQWDSPPYKFPDVSLADDDDIGEELSKKEDHFALFGMSRRIKEKYMTDDELERWGDDPWWRNDDERE